MSDTSGKTASSLAIVEKRPQRPGGCVGIFFQLFDWNRKFAKKKLFSKKLLPPVRLKKASKRFGGDEKLPKLRLIADENSGGFPNVKKNDGACDVDSEQKHEMRPPGLVARLMGLESIPAVQRDKLKKASLSGIGSGEGEKNVDSHRRFKKEEFNVEKGEVKHELRPHKLQKTGLSERKPATRFGAEALQLKNVLSRSRKNHQKLLSPVKSPRNLSGRSSSRLIGAATRILEPGLQRSRSKCALTYTSGAHHPPTTMDLMKETTDLSLESLEKPNYFQAAVLDGQASSCRNCGHLLDVTPNSGEQPLVFLPVSRNVDPSCQSQRVNTRQSIFCPVEEKGKNQEKSIFCASVAIGNAQPCPEYSTTKTPLSREAPRRWQATTTVCKIEKEISSSVGLKHKAQVQKQIIQERYRLPSKSKLSRPQSSKVSPAANASNETRNYVALNRKLSGNSRLRMPAKMSNCEFDIDKKFGDRKNDSLCPVRKRRSVNIPGQNEGPGFVLSTISRPTNIRSNVMSGKYTHTPCTKSRLVHLQESRNGDDGKDKTDAISFTFNSPMKRKTGSHAEVGERSQKYLSNCEVSLKRSTAQENDGRKGSQKSLPLSGDSLGALLEQKLRELTCQEEDELTFGDGTPKKTTAMILQELISALTTETLYRQENLASKLKHKKSTMCSEGDQSKINTPTSFQAKTKTIKNSVGYPLECEHLSPGSVLEASFSNDSCASSSLDDSSRYILSAESTEFCEEPLSLEPDADLLDSATSLSLGKFYRESVTNLLNNISEVFSSINLADVLLKGCKLTRAKEVILNADMVFGNAALPGAISNGGFSISRFVLNELETLASVLWTNFSGLVGFDGTKEGHEVKEFILDCVIEYLDSRFSRYSNSGFNAWTRLPLRMKTEMLICEIVEEVGRWAELAGLIPDELIEYDMSHSLGKWMDFELEAFETGAEIDQQILLTLIDELVIDFTGCGKASSDIA